MRLLQRDTKQGLAKVVVETADDLWYLHTLIDAGDVCTGQSDYKEKLGGTGEKTQVVRRRVWVAVAVAKTEFGSGSLRIAGTVTDGSEEVPRGSHHTLDVRPGDDLAIVKGRWLDYHEEKLREATESARLKTLLVLFDRETALFALLKPNGYERLLELRGNVPKKGLDEQKAHTFYADIVAKLREYDSRYGLQHAIAASPGFWSEYLRKELPPELARKTIFATVSAADESAITELLKRPELQQALAGQRAAREAGLVDELMAALARDRLVYGMADLQQAIAEANLSSITVTERAIGKAREEERFPELEAMLRAAADIGAKVHLLSTEEAMRRIDGLGGAVGVKRW